LGFRSASPRAIGAAIKDSELRRIRRKRFALFGHAAHMEPGVPAHDALWTALYIGVNCGSAPQAGWKQAPVNAPVPPGLNTSRETSMAWASWMPGIWHWLWIN